MNGLLERFRRLTRLQQALAAAALVIVFMGALVMFRSPKAVAAFVAVMSLAGLVLLAYQQMLAKKDRRRAGPLVQGLLGNLAAPMTGMSQPARRARLEDLRKSFESGLQRFREAGKNVYSVPWYVVVGEPGSGKSEAIRRCGVGFPPGLQDELQGAGGTLNMNWWFTNQAVLLDTAGRLMFEDVEPGTTGEWAELLKMLRRSRPECPINGMLLVIPAESLVRDAPEAIERKAGRIAQQLDQVQRALGVRFPVYVVVTKCDLLNGFREFFDGISDPRLQHQMLGWSNPAELDAPFHPETVDQHIRSVRGRLMRRRMGLLLDPVNSENPQAARTEQVDALYEFPESFADIGPRLRQYLATIFTPGEWSSRPLFLRGIYFTSSLREGEALDAGLAEALGVPVEALPEGRVWDRERSFFLRDLFTSKIFAERGLVTRAASTGRQIAMRRATVLGVAGGGLVALGLLSLIGHRALQEALLGPTQFWSGLSRAARAGVEPADPALGLPARVLPIVAPRARGSGEFVYRSAPGAVDPLLESLPVDDASKTRAGIYGELRAQCERPLRAPWVYAPIAWISGESGFDVATDERLAASRALFDASILATLTDSVAARFVQDGRVDRPWTPAAMGAFAQALRAHAAAVPGSGVEPPRLEPMFKYVLGSAEAYARTSAPQDAATLEAFEAWAASQRSRDGAARLALSPLPEGAMDAALAAMSRSAVVSEPGSGLASVERLGEALRAFAAAERELHGIEIGLPPEEWIAAWNTRTAGAAEARKGVDTALAALGGRPLARALREEVAAYRRGRQEEVRAILAQIAPLLSLTSSGTDDGAARARLEWLRKAHRELSLLNAALDGPPAELDSRIAEAAKLQAGYVGDPDRPLYAVRTALYQRMGERLGAVDAVTVTLAEIDADLAADRRLIDDQLVERLAVNAEDTGANTVIAAGRASARRAAEIGAERRRGAIVQNLLRSLPRSAEEIASEVAGGAEAAALAPSPPMLRVGNEIADRRYDPTAAAAALSRIGMTLESASTGGGGESVVSAAAGARRAADEYARRLVEHWGAGMERSVSAASPAGWRGLREDLTRLSDAQPILKAMGEINARREAALAKIGPVIARHHSALTREIEASRARAAAAGATLRDAAFGDACDGAVRRWRALPADRAEAERIVTEAVASSPTDQRYVLRAQGDDWVRQCWQTLTVSWARSLVAEPGGAGSPRR